MNRLLLYCSLILALFASPLFGQEWTKTFDVTGRPNVRITADDSRVRVRSCDCKQVQARVSWQGYRADQVRITPSQSGDRVTLEVRTHQVHVGFDFGHRSVQIEMIVPKELTLDVQTGDGRVEAADLKGDLRFKTGDGSIELSNLDGVLEAKSGDGHVRVSGRFDDLHVQTSDGPVEIEALKGSLINGLWEVHTGDGSVRIRLPGDIQASFEAKTGDGRIHTDFPVTMTGNLSETHHLEGKINGGGGLLSIRTGDGSVYLDKD